MKKRLILILTTVVIMLVFCISCGKKSPDDDVTVRIGSLKGPTSIGLVKMMEQQENGENDNNYAFTMEATADMLLPKMIKGELDIVLIPANVASVLYNKTEGEVSVIDINTLGVLYMVSSDESIQSMKDVKGRTIYLTGKGTTPDILLQYLLEQNGIALSEVTLQYKSEATEVAAVLAANEDALGVLPQPYVTALQVKNSEIKIAVDMTKEWDALDNGSMMVTGVTVVRNEFLSKYPDLVNTFIKEHGESAAYVNENVDSAAALVEKFGIVEKKAIAKAAIPYCNVTCITKEEMVLALSGYLKVLYENDAAFIGGTLPGDDFYYCE